MKQFIQITKHTGHVYEIPVSVIAEHRAAAMLAAHPDEFADMAAAMEDTTGLFKDDSWNIKDWAANNMNWPDVQRHAKLIRFTPPDEGQWYDGEFTYHDMPAMMGELDGDTLMSQPVELVMTTMALQRQLCNATILQGANGEPYGAFVMIFGDRPIINTYMNALRYVGDQITGQQAQTPAH